MIAATEGRARRWQAARRLAVPVAAIILTALAVAGMAWYAVAFTPPPSP